MSSPDSGPTSGPETGRDEVMSAVACTLPDAAVHAVVAALSPPAWGALRLASASWADAVARCLDELSISLPSPGPSTGCCSRHVRQQHGAAVAAVRQRFGGAAALRIRASRGALHAAQAAAPPPAATQQQQHHHHHQQQQQHAQQQQGSSTCTSLKQLRDLPRLRSLSLAVEGEAAPRGGCGAASPPKPCWTCVLERKPAAAVAAGAVGGGCHPCAQQQQQQQQQQTVRAAPCAALFCDGLSALTRLTALQLLGSGAYAPHPLSSPPAPAPGAPRPSAAGGACSALGAELARLPLRRLDTDQLELLSRPGAEGSDLRLLQRLESLRLRVPYLSRRSLWLEVAALPGLTSLEVDVARCAPGSRFHLRDALVPLSCLPGLAALSLGGFHSLCDRDLALATHLRALTALRLRLQPGPYHAEEPSPGGAVSPAGAAALALGLPRLAALSLAGCCVPRGALGALAAGLKGLRELDVSGVPEADDAFFVAAAPALPRLASLRAARCAGAGDASLAALARDCPELEELDFSGPPRACVTDRGVAALRALPRLRSLSLGGCARVTAVGLAVMLAAPPRPPPGGAALTTLPPPATTPAPPPPLETLVLSGCAGLSDAALSPVGEALAATLITLRLDGCPQITNRGLRRLLPLGELRELLLEGTLVQPQGPAWRALSARVHRLSCDPQAGLHLVGLD